MNRSVAYRMALGALVLILVAIASVPTYAQGDLAEVTNTTCPVTAGEPVDPTKYLDHDGRRVYFCCDRCLNRFKANPSRYADGLARVMPVSAPETNDTSGGVSLSLASTASEANHTEGHDHDSTDEHSHMGAEHRDEVSSVAQENQNHEHTTGAAPRPGAGEAALLDAGHDHSAHEVQGESSFLARAVNWIGKSHPPATHFPIGLLTAAAFAELLFMRTKRPLFDNAAQFCVWLGAGGAVSAAVLGWCFAGFYLVDDTWILTTHRWLGTSVALLSLVVAGLSIVSHREGQAKRRPAYRATLFLTVSLVGATGFLGGAMIYGINHYAW